MSHFLCFNSENTEIAEADLKSDMKICKKRRYEENKFILVFHHSWLGAAFSLKCQARLGIKKQPIAVVTWDVNKMPAEYANEEKIRQEFS